MVWFVSKQGWLWSWSRDRQLCDLRDLSVVIASAGEKYWKLGSRWSLRLATREMECTHVVCLADVEMQGGVATSRVMAAL